jgi:hypothetical protein
MNDTLENLKTELTDLVNKYGGLFAEYEIIEDDYLLVHFDLASDYQCKKYNIDGGIFVSFDANNLPLHFSGEVITIDDPDLINGFILPFDPDYFEDLYHYLELIAQEISEGYMLPNQLDRREEDQ